MKNKIKEIAAKYGVTTEYSGKEKKMYLRGKNAGDAFSHIIRENYPNLGFDIVHPYMAVHIPHAQSESL